MGSDTHGIWPYETAEEPRVLRDVQIDYVAVTNNPLPGQEAVRLDMPRMPPPTKRMFRIGVDYFKSSGKWYAAAEFEREFRTCAGPDDAPGSAGEQLAYIHDVVSHVRGLRDCGAPDSLPGLSAVGWDGPILIRQTHHQVDGAWVHETRLMHLLMPRES